MQARYMLAHPGSVDTVSGATYRTPSSWWGPSHICDHPLLKREKPVDLALLALPPPKLPPVSELALPSFLGSRSSFLRNLDAVLSAL